MQSDEKSWISTTQTGDHTQPLNDETRLLVNMVFARLKAAYGHRFDSTYGDEDSLKVSKREWAYCIRDYSEAQLAKALHQCKIQFAWPPSIAEFIKLMIPSPEELGLPSTHLAYLESARCRQDPKTFAWSHPLVYHTACDVGLWRIQNGKEKDVLPVFTEIYQNNLLKLKNGSEFTIPDHIAIEDKSADTQLLEVKELSEQLNIESSDLYYLTLAKGSEVRKLFRTNALRKHPNFSEKLPE